MLLRLAALACISTLVTGCINSDTLVKVKPDGSGTIEQTTLMNVQAFKPMMQGLEKQGAAASPGVNEADLEKAAERMGGVTYVSGEPVKGPNGFEGVKALYSFADINAVRVDQDPHMTGSTTGFSTSPAAGDEEALRFKLTRAGDVSTLVVTFPDKPGGAAQESGQAAPGADATSPQMLAMMKTMFEGFKVAIDLEVLGTIVKTDADYVEGSRVTLLEMDLGTLLQDEEKLRQIQSKVKPGASISEVKPYLKDVKGIKINNPVVTVVYK